MLFVAMELDELFSINLFVFISFIAIDLLNSIKVIRLIYIFYNQCFLVTYSTPHAKTDKLEEPVNRELNVTRS